jgi:membrane protein DedA with SNARE-associated domain
MLAGMARMPFWRFQFFSAIGGLLWAALIGTAGYVLGSNLALVGIVIRDIGVGGLVVVVVIGLVVALARWRAVRQR